jgi:Na+-translocating ferredoxin:NAD+ oxidoreductase RNF subunit RnfB
MSQDKEEKNKSEVARIKRQIQAEYEAAYQALHGPAIVGQHSTITAHMENMCKYGDGLANIVGDEKAHGILIEIMDESEQAQRLLAEFNAIPSYFERFALSRYRKEARDE